MKYVPLVLVALVVVALGAAAVVYGEADDSPGLQLIGVVLVGGVIAWLTRRYVAARRR